MSSELIPLNLSEANIKKIIDAATKEKSATVKLSYDDINSASPHSIYVSDHQKKRLEKFIKEGDHNGNITLTISHNNLAIEGSGIIDIIKGVIPLFKTLAPKLAIGLASGAASALGGLAVDKISKAATGGGMDDTMPMGTVVLKKHMFHLNKKEIQDLDKVANSTQKIGSTPIHMEITPSKLNKDHKDRGLYLTEAQIKQLEVAKNKSKPTILKLSHKQVKHQGGWIGSLLASLAGTLLPSLLGLGKQGSGIDTSPTIAEVSQKVGLLRLEKQNLLDQKNNIEQRLDVLNKAIG